MTLTAPMRYQLARVRAAYSDAALYDDSTILRYLNDGLAAACERSRCLRSHTAITVLPNFQEYALPADWVATIGVYQGGNRMTPVSTRVSPRADAGPFYYSWDGVLGLVTIPTAPGSLLLHYARSHPTLGLDDTPDSQFGAEWYHLMRDYVVWHLMSLAYGAEKIGLAIAQRNLFDAGVAALERWVSSQNLAADKTVTHALNIVGQPVTREWAIG